MFMMWGVSMALTAAGVACVGWIVVEVHRVLGEVARLAPGARQAIASEMEQVSPGGTSWCTTRWVGELTGSTIR